MRVEFKGLLLAAFIDRTSLLLRRILLFFCWLILLLLKARLSLCCCCCKSLDVRVLREEESSQVSLLFWSILKLAPLNELFHGCTRCPLALLKNCLLAYVFDDMGLGAASEICGVIIFIIGTARKQSKSGGFDT
jgi:hypothetical protein